MATNMYLSTNESKKKKNKEEQKQTHRYGGHLMVARWEERWKG